MAAVPRQTTLLSPPERLAPPDLLQGLAPATRSAVLAIGLPRAYASGEPLFRQGEPHQGIHLIQGGLVKSFYNSEDGRELTLGFWSGGHYVGAPQVFGGGRHAWSSTAVADSRTLLLPGRQLRDLSSRHPDLAMAVVDALVHKSECYCALLQLLATHSMRVRLARLLVLLAAGPDRGSRHLSHAQLAAMIGSTRQWVSRSLAGFQAAGLVARDAEGGLQVLDAAALAALR